MLNISKTLHPLLVCAAKIDNFFVSHLCYSRDDLYHPSSQSPPCVEAFPKCPYKMLTKEETDPKREPAPERNDIGNTSFFPSTNMKRQPSWTQAFLPLMPIRPFSFLGNGTSAATTPMWQTTPSRTSNSPCRVTISANSLEDSKRKAKSQYDNIPDLNQQYLAELNWIERKYGPKRLKKDIVKESQNSILRPEGASRPTQLEKTTKGADDPATEADLSQYEKIRNQLIGNTLFLGALGLCAVWGIGTIRDVQSFAIGLLGSMAYVVLLSRSVDRLAEGAKTTGRQRADALQPARIAILVLLVLASAKNSDRISILPVLFGFFTYKLATLVPLLTGEAFE